MDLDAVPQACLSEHANNVASTGSMKNGCMGRIQIVVKKISYGDAVGRIGPSWMFERDDGIFKRPEVGNIQMELR